MSTPDEQELNALVDAELSADQQAEMLEMMRNDPELTRRACELVQLKAQLRLAYADPPRSGGRPAASPGRRWRAAAGGGALFAAGLAGGWLLHAGALPTGGDRPAATAPADPGRTTARATDRETRIVFHISGDDQVAAGNLLDEVETMLQSYRSSGRALRVEVVGNSKGLDLLRESLSQHKQRIHELAERFPNLTFVACQNTIDRLRVEHGVEVKLLPDAALTASGVVHVVERQKEGWSYIRV